MNLAAQYESQQRFEIAIKWYKISFTISPDLLDSYYGYAICQFKNGKPNDAAEQLTIAIKKIRDGKSDDEWKPPRKRIYFWYLRSLCYKVMK